MMQSIDTVVIGGGQAGLATSYCLRQRGREHAVLEQSEQAGNAWRNGRWDSFTFVTPNWTLRLPGAEYSGDEPDGFMPRDRIVATFEDYVDRFKLPVQYGVRVTSVKRNDDSGRYQIRTDDANYDARNVVVATGPFQRAKIPPFAAGLPARITQLHSGEYRNPDALPAGAVLVVGSAQSGSQIAEELYRSGRQVYLSVGSAGRIPRRYRGKDIVEWMYEMGLFDHTVDTLPSPKAKFAPNPHLSGRAGGRTLNLHQFARDGVTLLGHVRSAGEDAVQLAPDLHESLAKVDRFEIELVQTVDAYIAETGVSAPEETLPHLDDGYHMEELSELNLRSSGISTIIWAMGYTFDYSLVGLPVFDGDGYPLQTRGVTRYPGLYFVGLAWMHKRKSSLLMGIGEDAEFIASALAEDHRD